MGDPNSFTTLMAMVENHLSKTNLPISLNSQGQGGSSFSLPNICNVRSNNSEQFLLPPPATVMQLPRFDVKNSEVTDILAHQVKNMLMAKENALNEENEKQRLADGLKSMNLKDSDNDDYIIDLSDSIIKPGPSQLPQEVKLPMLSNSSSEDSLFSEIDKDIAKKLQEPKEEPLPTCEDMSYILYQRVKRARCSSFGKVLTSRMKPVAAPYLCPRMSNRDVVPFDFMTPSPCEVIKARRRHPPTDQYSQMNVMDRIMTTTKDEKL